MTDAPEATGADRSTMTTTVVPETTEIPREPIEGTVTEPEAPMDATEALAAQQAAAAGEQADTATTGTTIVRRGAMDLTLSQSQDELTPAQRTALQAVLNFKPDEEPGSWPSIDAFLHMCIKSGLDPFRRQAYLIARGRSNDRKYTMQIGIDGFRTGAIRTGLFVRKAETVWTGTDDDEQSYWFDREKGIMRRLWFDQWPESRGHPGAARVTIEHRDPLTGVIIETSAVADWRMFAPYTDKYEGYGQDRRKVTDPATHKPVQELNAMWTKGGPHMLAKCAEALAIRQAHPDAFSGVYGHEEMHRLDQVERDRLGIEQRARRRQAFETANPSQQEAEAGQEPGEAPSGPLLDVGQPDPNVVDAEVVEDAESVAAQPIEADDETVQAWLQDEVAMIADIVGKPITTLCRRAMIQHKHNVEDFTIDQLRAVVTALRPTAVEALRAKGQTDQADAYERVTPSEVGPMERLLGQEAQPDAVA